MKNWNEVYIKNGANYNSILYDVIDNSVTSFDISNVDTDDEDDLPDGTGIGTFKPDYRDNMGTLIVDNTTPAGFTDVTTLTLNDELYFGLDRTFDGIYCSIYTDASYTDRLNIEYYTGVSGNEWARLPIQIPYNLSESGANKHISLCD